MSTTNLFWTRSASGRIQNNTLTSYNATGNNGEYHIFKTAFSRGRKDHTFRAQYSTWARTTFDLSFRTNGDDAWTSFPDQFKSLKDAKAQAQQHANQA